jgi:hypothetical protein
MLGVIESLGLGQPSGRHHLRDQALDADVAQQKPVDVDAVLAERACLGVPSYGVRARASLNPHSLGGSSFAAMPRNHSRASTARLILVAPMMAKRGERGIGEREHARVYPNARSDGGGGPQSKTDACVLVVSEPSPRDDGAVRHSGKFRNEAVAPLRAGR